MASLIANFKPIPTYKYESQQSSSNARNSACASAIAPATVNNWWENAPWYIKTIYDAARFLPWYSYYNSDIPEYTPIAFDRITSFSFYQVPGSDSITVAIYYYHEKVPRINSGGHYCSDRNDYLIIRLSPDPESPTRFKIENRRIMIERQPSSPTTLAIQSTMRNIYNIVANMVKLDLPPTSYQIMCTPCYFGKYIGHPTNHPKWECTTTYNSPGTPNGSTTRTSYPREIMSSS